MGSLSSRSTSSPTSRASCPILQLYMYNVTKKLTGPATTDTGLKFLTKATVGPYVSTKSRYEGTSNSIGVQQA